MKLYLAIESAFTNDGTFETVYGVFSTPEKAMESMEICSWFEQSKPTQREWCRRHTVDGELSVEFEVVEVELNKERFT